ncbi:hypothetical protein C9374_001977 [Naegleria lovaniensis]|uniref:Uncharacterized protein n=1 Tax=Naegleria lovaniensis TaxID=51637 RepID=A0AA88GTV4_NAELO|nr:uncharacterized protein C9374_001977 [Naegleria lovaniensis]KAG2386942.1 hypothetical protein C9374_001977 [Naegleria lovaniensis]
MQHPSNQPPSSNNPSSSSTNANNNNTAALAQMMQLSMNRGSGTGVTGGGTTLLPGSNMAQLMQAFNSAGNVDPSSAAAAMVTNMAALASARGINPSVLARSGLMGIPPVGMGMIPNVGNNTNTNNNNNNNTSTTTNTTSGSGVIHPSTSHLISSTQQQNTQNKWHDAVSKASRQILFNKIAEFKHNRPFSADELSDDKKSILSHVSKEWKSASTKEQFAKSVAIWLGKEGSKTSVDEMEKALLDILKKNSSSSSTHSGNNSGNSGGGNSNILDHTTHSSTTATGGTSTLTKDNSLFNMMATAATSIGNNTGNIPNMTNPVLSTNTAAASKLLSGNMSGVATTTTTTTGSTSIHPTTTATTTTTSTTTRLAVIQVILQLVTQPTRGLNSELTAEQKQQYLQIVDYLKPHIQTLTNIIQPLQKQVISLKKAAEENKLTPEGRKDLEKKSMYFQELLTIITFIKDENGSRKKLDTLKEQSLLGAKHIRNSIDAKLNAHERGTVQPGLGPTATTGATTTAGTTTAAATTTGTTTTASTAAMTSTTSSSGTGSGTGSGTTSSTTSSGSGTTSSTSIPHNTSTTIVLPSTTSSSKNMDLVLVQFLKEKVTEVSMIECCKKLHEASMNPLNEDAFYTSISDMMNNDMMNNEELLLLNHKKRKLSIPTGLKDQKKRMQPTDILKRSLHSLKLKQIHVLSVKYKLNVEHLEDMRYQINFVVTPEEKGILTLPNLSISVIVNHNDILPYSISFRNNYPNDKNNVFVNIRKSFNSLLIEKTTSFIDPSTTMSVHNNTYHIQRCNLSLPFILNSWILAINQVIDNELME